MKKSTFFKIALMATPIFSLLFLSNSSGKTGAYSGSPGGNGTTCTACHGGSSNYGASLDIVTDIPSGGYALNTSYNITVEVIGSTANNHGFQIVSERTSDHTDTGSFAAGTNSRLVDGGQHVTHNNSASRKWEFTWTSPDTDQGPIEFYAASVAGNGSGSSNDQVTTANSSAMTLSGVDAAGIGKVNFYPNPAKDAFFVDIPSDHTGVLFELFNNEGRLLKKEQLQAGQNKINTSDLASGTYQIRYHLEEKNLQQSLIIE
jgi:hypothetical protein